MAHSKQAQKRMRQNVKRRELNKARRSSMRSSAKKFEASVVDGDLEKARELLAEAMKRIDKAAKRNVIHKNNAARRKAALSRRLNALAAGKKS